MVAIIGVYLSTSLVSGSLEERFTRQLIEAGSSTADVLAQRERLHVSQLNAIAFTLGIDEAILADDREQLQTLVFPLVLNNNVDRVDIVDLEGRQLLEIHRPPGAESVEDYAMTSGADLSDWPIVQKVLAGVTDAKGDKFVTLANLDRQDSFITVGPVQQGDNTVGAVLISSYTHQLLQTLAQASFAEIILYDLDGRLVDTTFPDGKKAAPLTEMGPEARAMLAVDGESSLRRSFTLGEREYDALFGIFRARGEPLGFYAVALQTTPIVTYGTTARNQMVLIFATALLLVFGIGYLTANAITGRVQHLMENAMAVASGDFTRRTHISSADEIGSLAQSLDNMTESLANYTSALQSRIDELVALYESSTAVTVKSGLNLEHVLQAVTHSVGEVIRGTNQVVIHLLDETGQTLVPRAAEPNQIHSYTSLAVSKQGKMNALLTAAKPQVINLAELNPYTPTGYFTTNGITNLLLAPLIAGKEPIGTLMVILDPAVPQASLLDESTERLLGTVANQAAIAIKNAQLFEATQRAYEELRQLDDLKTQFINIAAHELRTPLGAMLGYASYVEKRVPPKLLKSMRFLKSSMLRMRTMVDAMLTIQRLDAGTSFLRPTPVDLRDILKKVILDYQPIAELEGHVIDINLPDRLPLINADTEKVALILSNLMSNAIKFTAEGGRIEIKARDVAKGIIISVADNGVGITPEDQKRIFERFYQVRPDHLAGHGGMGIGLTIVKHLVELHEGELWVESEAGKGSTFSFLLPKKQSTDLPETVPVAANTDQYQDEKLLEGA
jgi:signal transduction histidine kinase/HAMP domain-containing protein